MAFGMFTSTQQGHGAPLEQRLTYQYHQSIRNVAPLFFSATEAMVVVVKHSWASFVRSASWGVRYLCLQPGRGEGHAGGRGESRLQMKGTGS